jgi:hypothetical protein
VGVGVSVSVSKIVKRRRMCENVVLIRKDMNLKLMTVVPFLFLLRLLESSKIVFAFLILALAELT